MSISTIAKSLVTISMNDRDITRKYPRNIPKIHSIISVICVIKHSTQDINSTIITTNGLLVCYVKLISATEIAGQNTILGKSSNRFLSDNKPYKIHGNVNSFILSLSSTFKAYLSQ